MPRNCRAAKCVNSLVKRHQVQGLDARLKRWSRDSRTEAFDADGFVAFYFDGEEAALTSAKEVS